MSISGIAGAPSVPFVPPSQSLAQAGSPGTSAASPPAQQIAAGHHHHHPPINSAGVTSGTVAASPPGSAGVNTVA